MKTRLPHRNAAAPSNAEDHVRKAHESASGSRQEGKSPRHRNSSRARDHQTGPEPEIESISERDSAGAEYDDGDIEEPTDEEAEEDEDEEEDEEEEEEENEEDDNEDNAEGDDVYEPVGRRGTEERGRNSEPPLWSAPVDTPMRDVELDFDPFFGERQRLQDMFAATEKFKKDDNYSAFYDSAAREETELPVMKELCAFCLQCGDSFRELQVAVGEAKGGAEMAVHTSFNRITTLLNGLNLDMHADDKNQLLTQIYVYGLPALMSLLEAATQYDIVTATAEYRTQLSLDELKFLLRLLEAINNLGERIRLDWKDIHPNAAVSKTLRAGVLAPVKKVLSALLVQNKRLQSARDREQDRATRQLAAQRRLKRELEADRNRGRHRALVRRLEALCLQRMWAEPNRRRWAWHHMPPLKPVRLLARTKTQPLVEVPADECRDLDVAETGLSSYRSFVDEEPWTDEENKMLLEGLWRFYGTFLALGRASSACANPLPSGSADPDTEESSVWPLIFRHYCGIDGALRDRRVQDILRQARYIRGEVIADDVAKGGKTDDWLLDIPDLDLVQLF